MTAPNARERILPRLIDEEIKESFISDIIPKTCLPGWISLYSGQALKDIYYPDTTLI
jgi:hypothetical protein